MAEIGTRTRYYTCSITCKFEKQSRSGDVDFYDNSIVRGGIGAKFKLIQAFMLVFNNSGLPHSSGNKIP